MLNQIASVLELMAGDSDFAVQSSLPVTSLIFTVGKISSMKLPLTPASVAKLIQQAEPASYGYKEQTLLDKSVRDAWKIKAEQVHFHTLSWHASLQAAVDKMKLRLGLSPQSELRAELQDMLVYEAGQFFKPHKDSEKCDGMVATLVVIVPSKHKGGKLLVKHQGSQHEFHSDKLCNDTLGLFAFYADCEHEVFPVEQGYRVALTYNLVLKNSVKTEATESWQSLCHVLKPYFADPENKQLVYLLDHEYSQAGLSWDALKGRDDMSVAAFKRCAEQLELDMYLCLAEFQETWDCEDDYDYGYNRRRRYYDDDDEEGEEDDSDHDNIVTTDLCDSNLTLQYWLGLDGKQVQLPNYSVRGKFICWTTENEDFSPFKTEYEGWTGNAGSTLDRWYHRAAVVLWPKSAHYARLLDVAPTQLIDELLVMDAPQKVVRQLLPEWRGYHVSDHAVPLLQLALKLQDAELAQGLLKPVGASLLQAEYVVLFTQLQHVYGESWLLALLQEWLQPSEKYANPVSLIDRIASVIQAWVQQTQHQAITHLLLAHQLALSIKAHTSSITRPASHKQYSARRIAEICCLLDAAKFSQDTAIIEQIVQQVQSLSHVYALLEQAKIALHLKYPSTLASTVYAQLGYALAQPARAADDWQISNASTCNCADCAELNKFLVSNSNRKIWPLAEQRRRHIHNIIADIDIPVTHETERKGSPYKLHLLKTNKLFENEALLREQWQAALEQLQTLV